MTRSAQGNPLSDSGNYINIFIFHWPSITYFIIFTFTYVLHKIIWAELIDKRIAYFPSTGTLVSPFNYEHFCGGHYCRSQRSSSSLPLEHMSNKLPSSLMTGMATCPIVANKPWVKLTNLIAAWMHFAAHVQLPAPFSSLPASRKHVS